MLELNGDIWRFHDQGYSIVIPTNGVVTRTGELVMGRGLALQAMKKWRSLPGVLGHLVVAYGNHVFDVPHYGLFTFPVKEHWKDRASLTLIERSALELKAKAADGDQIYLPRVGCGNGRLEWKVVRPILKKILTSDRFIVVTLDKFRTG